MIKQLIAALVEAGADVDAEAIADALWLMRCPPGRIRGWRSSTASAIQPAPPSPAHPMPSHGTRLTAAAAGDWARWGRSQAAFGSDAAGSIDCVPQAARTARGP